MNGNEESGTRNDKWGGVSLSDLRIMCEEHYLERGVATASKDVQHEIIVRHMVTKEFFSAEPENILNNSDLLNSVASVGKADVAFTIDSEFRIVSICLLSEISAAYFNEKLSPTIKTWLLNQVEMRHTPEERKQWSSLLEEERNSWHKPKAPAVEEDEPEDINERLLFRRHCSYCKEMLVEKQPLEKKNRNRYNCPNATSSSDKHDFNIYLNSCWNCKKAIIDSRCCEKERFGWYLCPNCGAGKPPHWNQEDDEWEFFSQPPSWLDNVFVNIDDKLPF